MDTTAKEVFCFDGPSNLGGDPHALVLRLNEEDAAKYGEQRDHEADLRLASYEVGQPVVVTDQKTGRLFKLATAPCGAPCRCAAVAEPVEGAA